MMADPAAAAAAEPALPPINVSAGGRDSSSPVSTPFSHPRSPWLIGLAAVIFDVDKGQTLQDVWPPDCLSEAEQAAVAFHSFPDSLSMELYSRSAVKDSSFTFRIKREPQPATNSSSSTAGAGGYTPAAFLYGYVFCRQRQDESLRRGGEQASVVVLSLAPLGSALLPLSQAAGHAFFSEGPIALAAVYNQVLMWPPPLPGGSMCLPLAAGGGVINARVPHFCLLPPPQPEVDAGLAASLTRRASRTISLRAGYSPRAPAASSISISRQGSEAAEQQQQQQVVGAQAAAAAAADGDDDSKGGQQQEGGDQAGSSFARSGSHGSSQELAAVGARPNSASRLSRPDLASGGSDTNTNSSIKPGSSSSSSAAAAAAAQEAPAAAASGLAPPPGAYHDWLGQQLGQHWRDETPFPEVEPALALAPLLKELWTLWQLVVTGQPLMVVGLTPADTSAATAALAALVAPLPLAADHRPYFTIHDPDFIALAAGRLPARRRYREPRRAQQPPAGSSASQADAAAAAAGDEQQQQQAQQAQDGSAPAAAPPNKEQQARAAAAAAAAAALAGDLPVVLGVTNQHFVKILPAWPNVVAVSRKEPAAGAAAAAAAAAGGGLSGSGGSTGVSRSSSPGARPASFVSEGGAAAGAAALAQQAGAAGAPSGGSSTSSSVPPAAAGGRFGSGLLSSTAAAAVRALQRRHQGPQHLLSHFAPHLWTSRGHTQFIRPDHALLSKARAAIEPAVGACASPAAAAVAAALAGGGGSSSGSGGSGSSGAATAAARLRRHFAGLSAALLSVFDPYFTPGPSGKVPAWRPEAFLASLNPGSLPPALAARLWGNAGAAARGLLGAFIDSPNFAFWFAQRRAAVAHLIEEDAGSEDGEDDDGFARVGAADGDLSDAGVASGSGDDDDGGDEVELVQQLLSAEAALTQWQQQHQQQAPAASGDAASPPGSSSEQAEQLQALQLRFGAAFARLPRDLAVAMVATPARQELLAAAAEALLDSSSRGPDSPPGAAAAGERSQQQQASASAVGERLQLLLAELLQTAADRA